MLKKKFFIFFFARNKYKFYNKSIKKKENNLIISEIK